MQLFPVFAGVRQLAYPGWSTSRRSLYKSAICQVITHLQMPAMSPTMTEGGIAQWKKKDGEPFSAGDILLEIETDKATIDVEAQDDGIMGKILIPDGAKNVLVGKVIALLAEEGDDISNLQPPNEEISVHREAALSESAHAEQPAPTLDAKPPPRTQSTHKQHSRPLFPSVQRLLLENDILNPAEIKATGKRGMLTKGDVLMYLGKASTPTGTYQEIKSVHVEKKGEDKPLDGPALRRLIVSTLLQNSIAARQTSSGKCSNVPGVEMLAHIIVSKAVPDFNSIIADYLPHNASEDKIRALNPQATADNYLDGLI